MDKPTAYQAITRTMVENIAQEIREVKNAIGEIKEENRLMFNHLSNRLPLWASTLITLLITIVGIGLTIMLK